MKIKYKLIIAFSLLILAIGIPLVIIIPTHQEREIRKLVHHHGTLYSQLLSRLTCNILLANAADILAAKVDVSELLTSIEFLSSHGLVYADCVLLSSNPALDGLILSHKTYGKSLETTQKKERLTCSELYDLKGTTKKNTVLENITGTVYMFSAIAHLPSLKNVCGARLFFSEEAMLAPIRKLRLLSYFVIVVVVMLGIIVSLFFSKIISHPIEKLIDGLIAIEREGSYTSVQIKSKDEIGRLATTFNHMFRMLHLNVQSLIESNRELRRIDALKNEFLANTSRELIEPLKNILHIAHSFTANNKTLLSEEAQREISLIIANAQRLSTLVNAMLDFSRLKNKDINLSFTVIDIHSAVEAVISSLRPHIEKKGLLAINRIPPRQYFVEADEARLNRILINLIHNAVKFTEKGCIEVSITETDDNMIRVSIKDTGVGIPQERIATIFEPFDHPHIYTNYPHYGSGLGLPIVKKLVDLHGGTIDVHSEEGVGTTFSFTLRKATQTTSVNNQSVILSQDIEITADFFHVNLPRDINSSENAILVVDDDPLHLQSLISFLNANGYTTIACTNGIEALDIVEAHQNIGLVILDVMMPKISGYDVARTIRQRFQSHELPIIMITTRSYPEDIVAGFEAGSNDYLTKPINSIELLARVKSLLALRNAVQEHNELSILKHDVAIAHYIQNSILPSAFPTIKGLSIAVRYIPMTDLGGDLYDFYEHSDGSLEVFIAVASGHGIPAALISAMTSIAYRFSCTLHYNLPKKIVHINNAISSYEHGQFITACLVHISDDRKTLTFTNAGHWPIIVHRRTTDTVELFRDEGVPLGWLENASYFENRISLTKGDRIVLFTDGIIECKNHKEEIFGIERFEELIHQFSHQSAEQFAESILIEIKRWSEKKEPFNDDVTLLVIDVEL